MKIFKRGNPYNEPYICRCKGCGAVFTCRHSDIVGMYVALVKCPTIGCDAYAAPKFMNILQRWWYK